MKLSRASSVPDGGFDADQFIREFDEGDRFDLASFKRAPLRGDASALDVNSFGDPVHISRAARERDRRRTTGVPYLSSSSIMEWQPRWLGSMLAPSERTNHRRQRMKASPHSAASLCNAAAAFWLSHAAIGQVELGSVLAHLLVLLRLADERGLDVTIRYVSLLHQELHTRITEGEEFSLDGVISKIDHNLVRRAEPRRVELTPAPSQKAARRPKAGSEGLSKNPPESAKPAAASPAVVPNRNVPVCFAHDPASGRTCPNLKTCSKAHLDTTKPDDLERFSRARSAFDKKKGKSSAGKARI